MCVPKSRPKSLVSVVLFVLPLLLSVTGNGFAAEPSEPSEQWKAGFKLERFAYSDPQRPVLIDWWYPAREGSPAVFDYGLGQGRVVEQGTLAPGLYPLIVLSHGAFGAARNYSWIAEALVRAGYLVAGVSHYGESYVYGASTIDPWAVLDVRARPRDISAVLDFVEERSWATRSVDWQRIGFLGHSSGGATGLLLAGARFDEQQMGHHCTTKAAARARGCDYAKNRFSNRANSRSAEALLSHRDKRIAAVVLLDPALGPGFYDYSNIDRDIAGLVVGSANNDFLPAEFHAGLIGSRWPGAETHWLSSGEGHFVYLNECARDLFANSVALCADRPNVSRRAVHRELEGYILSFFAREILGKLRDAKWD